MLFISLLPSIIALTQTVGKIFGESVTNTVCVCVCVSNSNAKITEINMLTMMKIIITLHYDEVQFLKYTLSKRDF